MGGLLSRDEELVGKLFATSLQTLFEHAFAGALLDENEHFSHVPKAAYIACVVMMNFSRNGRTQKPLLFAAPRV